MPDPASGKISFASALTKLQDLAVDLTSLTVETWTGDIGAVMAGSSQGEPAHIDWSRLAATVKEKTEADGSTTRTLTYGGDYELVAATRVAIDHDTWNFRSRKAQSDWPELLSLHDASLQSAIAGRQALLGLFVDVIKPKTGG